MKAAEVRIRKALELGESYVDPTFVLVETTLGDDGETVTTIEHLASYIVNGQRPVADRDVRPIGPAVARCRTRVGGLVRGKPRYPDRLRTRRLVSAPSRRGAEHRRDGLDF